MQSAGIQACPVVLLRHKACKGPVDLNYVVWQKHILPRAITYGGSALAPLDSGLSLLLDLGDVNIAHPLDLAEVAPNGCLHDEVRIVVVVISVLDLQHVLGRLQPLDHIAIIFQDRGKAAFWIGIEFLRRIWPPVIGKISWSAMAT
jgi:hypothetical protein